MVYPDRRGEVQLLSDDGGVLSDGVECKELEAGRRGFRAAWVPVP